MGTFSGQVAVVTGGSRGLGYAIADQLVEGGADVAIVGRSEEALLDAASRLAAVGTNVMPFAADLSTAEGVSSLFVRIAEWRSSLHILVNNAGIAEEGEYLDITRESWEKVIGVNLSAPFYLSQEAARLMSAGGAIVNIGSVDAYAADGPFASYSVAKAGLVALTKNAAVQLASLGIRVNTVSPGWALTDMAVETTSPKMLEAMKHAFDRVPLRRLVTPAEVAAAVTFLLSPAASGITGIDLPVDGGTLANLYILETLAKEDQ